MSLLSISSFLIILISVFLSEVHYQPYHELTDKHYSSELTDKHYSSYHSCIFEVDENYDKYSFVYQAFQNNGHYPKCRRTNDKKYPIIPITVNEKRLKYGRDICSQSTFVIVMICINTKDVERRQLLRQYYKQGMRVEGEKLNYFFIEAIGEDDQITLKMIEEENDRYHDIVVSLHVDSYHNLTMTVLDGFLYIRNHCNQTKYASKIDGDTFVPLGNMMMYLKQSPRNGFYGGKPYKYYYPLSNETTGRYYVPFDYKGDRLMTFTHGGAYFISNDLIPYINIGCYYSPVILPASEDSIVGGILKMVNVSIHGNREYKAEDRPERIYGSNYSSWPRDILFYHRMKNLTYLREIYSYFGSTIYCHHYICS